MAKNANFKNWVFFFQFKKTSQLDRNRNGHLDYNEALEAVRILESSRSQSAYGQTPSYTTGSYGSTGGYNTFSDYTAASPYTGGQVVYPAYGANPDYASVIRKFDVNGDGNITGLFVYLILV